MNPLLSIIIPCYNAENLIERCISSILASDFTDYEIILVNDGSTDNTSAKLDLLQKSDNRIHCFNKKNGGASSARNFGTMRATGEWITFIDADDYILPAYLGHFFETDNITGNLKIQGAIRREIASDISLSFKQHETLEIKNDAIFYRGELLHFGYSCGKLYNLNIIRSNNIKFDEETPYKEDLIFLLEFLKYCETITFLPYTDYIYMQTTGSLSATWLPMDMRQNIYYRIRQLVSEFNKGSISKQLSDYFLTYDTLCIKEFLRSVYHRGKYNRTERIHYLKWIRNSVTIKAYPHSFRSDTLLSILFRCRMFHLYDTIQKHLFNIHTRTNLT